MIHCTRQSVILDKAQPLAEYIIVGAEPIVAQDLADTIRTNDREARIRIFRHPDEVLAAIQSIRPDAVIVQGARRGFPEAELVHRLTEGGIPIGLLGGDARIAGAAILASPFTEATVATLLEDLRRAARPPSALG
jgi:hypothetical protein